MAYLRNYESHADSISANVIGIAVTSRDTSTPTPGSGQQTCPAGFGCPANNGCSYTAGSRTLVLSCGTDFYGGDYANQYAEGLEACTQACAADTQCAAASFVGGTGAGTCYLKGVKNGGSINDNVNGTLNKSLCLKDFLTDANRHLSRHRLCAA